MANQNRVRDLRASRGLTQRELAQAVGTSQQQIQRIESGRQAVRFDLATRIADALNESLARVFPETAVPLRRLRRRNSDTTWADALSDPKARDALEQAGIDMDPELWFLKCRFRGGVESVFQVSGPDKERLWNAVQRLAYKRFVVFQSESQIVVLNLDHVLFGHFLFEPPNRIIDVDEGGKDDGVTVLFAGEADFHAFEVDADEPEPKDDSEEDEGQLRNLLFEAELSNEADDVLSFTDVDGETVFLRAADVALMQFPLWAIYPELDVSDEDEEPGEDVSAEEDV